MSDQARDDVSLQEVYYPERRLLIEAQREATMALDRSLITLSSGAVALTFVLLGHLVAVRWLPLVVLSWLGFVVSIGATLGSFWWSQGHLEAHRSLLGAYYMEMKEGDRASAETLQKNREYAQQMQDRRDSLVERTKKFNRVSMVAFFFGVVALLVFGCVNISNLSSGGTMSDRERTVERGPSERRGYTGHEVPPDLVPDRQPPPGAESVPDSTPPAGDDGGGSGTTQQE